MFCGDYIGYLHQYVTDKDTKTNDIYKYIKKDSQTI